MPLYELGLYCSRIMYTEWLSGFGSRAGVGVVCSSLAPRRTWPELEMRYSPHPTRVFCLWDTTDPRPSQKTLPKDTPRRPCSRAGRACSDGMELTVVIQEFAGVIRVFAV